MQMPRGSPPADWRRQLGRPRITWLSTVQQNLKQHHLTLPEATDFAQNRPVWRMMSTYGATQSWVACQKRRRRLDKRRKTRDEAICDGSHQLRCAENWYSLSNRTTPIFEPDLHFGSEYSEYMHLVQIHQLSFMSASPMLTWFCWFSGITLAVWLSGWPRST